MTNEISIKSLLPSICSIIVPQNTTYIGIDFGTSTTVVSIATFESETKSIKVLPIFLDQLLDDGAVFSSNKIASVIAFYNNKVLVGEGASRMKYQLKFGKDIWYSFKMDLGEDLGAKYFNSDLADVEPFKIRNPIDAARVFFMYLKMLIIRFCDKNGYSQNIKYAVSIPASFEANQRKELMEALEVNGMNVSKQSLIDEPNAAFLSYLHTSINSEKPLTVSSGYNPKVLVFDFGGGTCDISILEIGKDAKGIYSKNLSISKFTKLGGTDIDRYIAYHYLLPRFFKANGYKESDFKTPEKKYIVTQLFKAAEQLKILINKNLSLLMDNYTLPKIKDSDLATEIQVPVYVETRKGTLFQDKFNLTNEELTETMKVFMKKTLFATKIKGEDDYNTIFMPINSAIDKANLKVDELDYILLIGGSSQSPYIQETLKKYFEDSEILIPHDLQTHVSAGAAIHSLLLNGMNKCVIQPITSEPIIVVTKDISPKLLMRAGTSIPSDTIVIDDLVPSRDKQESIELPICVGNSNKMLYNLKISKDGGFPSAAHIRLTLEINADKILIIQASCASVSCMVEPQNPFANKELSTEERIVLAAERQTNLEAEANGGTPTKNSLIALRKAYSKAGNDFRAAETYEFQNELYPDNSCYNKIGVLYYNSGNVEKASSLYRKAIEISPNNPTLYFNLGYSLKSSDPDQSIQYIKKAYELDPTNGPTIIEMGSYDKRTGKDDEAKLKFQKAYDSLMKKWKTDCMADFEYSWLASVARELGEYNIALQVEHSKPSLSNEKYYNEDNLVKTQNKQLPGNGQKSIDNI
jgi:molecular chaperone DnaK